MQETSGVVAVAGRETKSQHRSLYPFPCSNHVGHKSRGNEPEQTSKMSNVRSLDDLKHDSDDDDGKHNELYTGGTRR